MVEGCIRILCVEDHAIVREGISLIINLQLDMKVVATAMTAQEAIARHRECLPDITLMDLNLGPTSGVQAIRQIRAEVPTARIVVLTMYQGDEDIFRALQAGATTYLFKDTISEKLISTLRDVYAAKALPLPPHIESRLADRASRPTLTPREQQVLELVSRGMRNREIGAALGVAVETVEVHIKNLFGKLEVNDRTAAVHVALRRGILHI